MKKFLLIILGLIVILLGTAFVLPIIFKDDIKAALDAEISNNVKATVFYDAEHLNLTLFKNFPNITVGMGDFGIVGIEQFEGDTLMSMGSFEVVVDIMSVINGERINVNSISLVEPEIYVVVLADGTANYDIAKSSDEPEEVVEETDTTSTAFNVGINKWEIIDGNLLYYDQSMDFYTTIMGLNHEGSGDFTQDLFDLTTLTTVDALSLGFEGEDYLANKKLLIDFTMAMDLPNGTYTFKQNRVALNEFGFGFDGVVAMPGEDIGVDLIFDSDEITIKSLFSLIPGTFKGYLDGLEASGNISFSGFVKGTYNENSMPAVNAKLKVNEGNIKYAEYPIPIENLTIDSEFNYPSADLTQTTFDLKQFSMLMDGEQLEATLAFKNLEDYNWDFAMDGNLDLAKLTKVVPLDSMELAGKINATLKTSGKMSDLEAERYNLLPTSGTLSINNFKFVSPDLPQGFGITNTQASLDPSSIKLSAFSGNIGKSDMSMTGSLSNYLGYILDESQILKGELIFSSNSFDLNEWMTEEEEEVVVEDTTSLEVIEVPTNIDFVLKSSIAEILYDNMTIKDLKGDIVVREGRVSMEGLAFNMLNGAFTMNGYYATGGLENPIFDFDLGIKDLSIAESYKTFNTIQTLAPIAEKMTGNFSTNFNIGGALGGDMMPLYDKLYGAGLIEIVQAAFKGDMKLMAAINGATKLTKLSGAETSTEQISLKDVLMQAEIRDGRVHLEPFNMVFGGYETTISGSNGIDGSMDYIMGMNVPTGQVASAVNNLLASKLGGANLVGENVKLNLGVGGTYDDPKITVRSVENSSGSSPTDAAKARLAAEAAKRREEAERRAERELARQQARAKAKADQVTDKAKEEVNKAKEEVVDKVTEEAQKLVGDQADDAKDAVKGLLKKKKKGGGN